jgi:hypothetical protein
MTKKIYYKKAFGIVMLISAAFILGISLYIGFTFNTLNGVLFVVIGMLYLNSSYLEYTDEEVIIKALFGNVVRRISLKIDKIEMIDGLFYANGKKIRVSKFNLVDHQVDDFMAERLKK